MRSLFVDLLEHDVINLEKLSSDLSEPAANNEEENAKDKHDKGLDDPEDEDLVDDLGDREVLPFILHSVAGLHSVSLKVSGLKSAT